jgi:uncharacterized protein
MTLIKAALTILFLLYLVAMEGMYFLQRQFQYFPLRADPRPAEVGLDGVQVERLATPDGETVVLWYAPARLGQPTILFFHGNGGDIAGRADRFAHYHAQGYGVAFLSYRGYGGSTGTISEAGFITDALTAYDWLIVQRIPPARIAVVGESLGTGVAVQLAAQRPVGAIILEAPYTAAVDVAAQVYPWLPVRWLMKDQFRSTDFIARITAPLLVLHGTRDPVIPYAMGQALFAAANEPKQFYELVGAGHDALYQPATWARGTAFLAQVFSP